MLDILGVDQTAERVYQDLVSRGPASAAGLAERTGLPDGAVERAVGALARFGLVTAQAEAAEEYIAAPPASALGALLIRQQYALHQAELTVAALAEAYSAASAERGARDLIEILSGPEAIRQRLEQIRGGAVTEFLALSEMRHGAAGRSGGQGEATQRGVRYRMVIEQASLQIPSAAQALEVHLRQRQSCRVVDKVPTKLVIADRSAALVPLSDGLPADGGDAVAMLVRAPGLIRLLVGLFESVWQRATPVRLAVSGEVEVVAEGGEPNSVDLRILSLLMGGSTDAAIANQLGLGLRTVQRRVAHMMQLAGVSTRLQLGWHACSLGWLR